MRLRQYYPTLYLGLTLVVAAILCFWALGRNDIITDESSLATRAIGMVDFDFGIEQPTPWQWMDRLPEGAVSPESRFAVPWWMRLSFHDQPPLVLLLEHWSMRLFGENAFAIRLPSVIASLAAVIFVYLIGKQLYSPLTGAISVLLFAFTLGHVWITRIGLQESIAIALMLASTYFFFRFILLPSSVAALPVATSSITIGRPIVTDEERRHREHRGKNQERNRGQLWLMAAAIFLGLAFLAKHYALILIPIFVTIVAIEIVAERRRQNIANLCDRISLRCNLKRLAVKTTIAVGLFLVIASPVIIYNIQLYRYFGHFDFQFSLLLGQDVKEWPSRPGQEVLGNYANRLKNYIPWLAESNSPYFLALAAFGLILIVSQIIFRNRLGLDRTSVISHRLLVIVFAWLLPFLVFIGPSYRFLTLLTPWLAIATGYAASQFIEKFQSRQAIGYLLLAALAVWEAFYAYNSVAALKPLGREPWTYAKISRYNNAWGFNELEKYIAGELEGKMPDPAITFEFPFAKEILNRAVKEGREKNLEAIPLAIVYNDNINLSASLWTFLRRITYNGWPVVTAADFRGEGQEFLAKADVRKILFINATEYALQDRPRPPTPDGDILESQLLAKGAKPEEIKNPRGEVAFRVYSFEFSQPKP